MSLLGVDIGSTNCKGAAYSTTGTRIASAAREHRMIRPRAGQVELDSGEIMRSVLDLIREVAGVAKTHGDPIQAISVSSLGESFTMVSQSGEVIRNAIHHSDTRGQAEINRFMEGISQKRLFAINPNIASASTSLAKLLWLRSNEPHLFDRMDRVLYFGDLLLQRLGCEALTSFSQANRSLLFDLEQQTWSAELLACAGLSVGILPRAVPSGTIAGTLDETIARNLGLTPGVPCVVGGHDQCCSALGMGVWDGGRAADGIGTVECITPVFASAPDRAPMLEANLHIEHHVVDGMYVTFIYNQAGSLLKWFRSTFAQNETGTAGEIYRRLDAEMPPSPTDLQVLPHFEPTGAPSYISNSAGAILGLKITSTRGEILKAIMEGQSFYFREALLPLGRIGIAPTSLVAGGGGARSAAWLQIKADIMGIPVEQAVDPETGVAGAAMIAGVGTGIFTGYREAAAQFVRRGRTFEPIKANKQAYDDKFEEYRQIHPRLTGRVVPRE